MSRPSQPVKQLCAAVLSLFLAGAAYADAPPPPVMAGKVASPFAAPAVAAEAAPAAVPQPVPLPAMAPTQSTVKPLVVDEPQSGLQSEILRKVAERSRYAKEPAHWRKRTFKKVPELKKAEVQKAADAVPPEAPKPNPYANVDVTKVSRDELNRFIFPDPVTKVVFPTNVYVGQPVYLDDNRVVLIQFQPGNPDVIQMVAAMKSGQTRVFWLKPESGPGATIRVDGAHEGQLSASTAAAAPGDLSPAAVASGLFMALAQHETPPGFDPVTPMAPVFFNKFEVMPVASFTDHASERIDVFRLIAAKGQEAVVSAPEFYRKGVLAVMVDGDRVDAGHSPLVYVLREQSDGGN